MTRNIINPEGVASLRKVFWLANSTENSEEPMKTETGSFKNLALGGWIGKSALPLSLKDIPISSTKFQLIPDNSTPDLTQVIDLKAGLSNLCRGTSIQNFPEVYISA